MCFLDAFLCLAVRSCVWASAALSFIHSLSASPSLSLTHSPSISQTDSCISPFLMLSFIRSTHSSSQHFPPSDLLKWTKGHLDSTFLPYVVNFQSHSPLIFPFNLYWTHWFLFLCTLQPVLCVTLIESIAFNWTVSCLYICLRLLFLHVHSYALQTDTKLPPCGLPCFLTIKLLRTQFDHKTESSTRCSGDVLFDQSTLNFMEKLDDIKTWKVLTIWISDSHCTCETQFTSSILCPS